jgi:hypothetical protein
MEDIKRLRDNTLNAQARQNRRRQEKLEAIQARKQLIRSKSRAVIELRRQRLEEIENEKNRLLQAEIGGETMADGGTGINIDDFLTSL